MWLVTSQYTGSVLLDLTGGKLVRLPGGQVVRWLGGGKIRPTSADMQKVVNFHIFFARMFEYKNKVNSYTNSTEKTMEAHSRKFSIYPKIEEQNKRFVLFVVLLT